MLKVTRWSPDTCGCILEYEWDDTKNESERTHTLKNIIKKCPAHHDEPIVFNTVLDENKRKNTAFHTILSEIAGIPETQLNARIEEEADTFLKTQFNISLVEARLEPMLVDNIRLASSLAERKLGLSQSEYLWSFDVNRVLQVSLPARVIEKHKIQNKCDAKFGANKLVIS